MSPNKSVDALGWVLFLIFKARVELSQVGNNFKCKEPIQTYAILLIVKRILQYILLNLFI